MGKIAMKWGEMSKGQRYRHQYLVGRMAREIKEGKSLEQIARENGYTLESTKDVAMYYNLV